MYSPRQSLYVRSGGGGVPLPQVFKSMDIQFFRGQFALICSAAGVGKSAFTLTYALRAKLPTLYFSPDSDAFTQMSRLEAILTGCTVREGEKRYRAKQMTPLADELPIQFIYDSPLMWDRIVDAMEAFSQKYGDYPGLVVVDNVTNVRAEQAAEDPFEGLESLMDVIHGKAKETGSFFIGLHHVTSTHNNATAPVPMGGVRQQLGRVPEVILTLHKTSLQPGRDVLNVSTVKNRSGRADPSGNTFVSLAFKGETMSITDPLT